MKNLLLCLSLTFSVLFLSFKTQSIHVLTITNNLDITRSLETVEISKADVLLFQPEIDAHSEKQLQLLEEEGFSKTELTDYCYSRFVPERSDDYAFGNNKVAFRNYGPTAQKMVEEGVKGGNFNAEINVNNNKAMYYAGFGWQEAKEFTSKQTWENHVVAFALKINNPLVVTIN
ncbi:DUF4861 family protein [Algibacter sp.]|uniref:DUF4861 family protein n=1 Tax=Algibacter sp. TaxID=1872428 RepID=UPI003C73B262